MHPGKLKYPSSKKPLKPNQTNMQGIEINSAHVFEHEINDNVQLLHRLSMPTVSVFLKL